MRRRLVFGIALCLTLSAVLVAAPGRSAGVPPSAGLVLIVNPSKLAKNLEVTHAKSIIRAVGGQNMTLFGIYEQVTAQDPHPYDLPFLQLKGFLARHMKPIEFHGIRIPEDSACDHAGWEHFRKAKCHHLFADWKTKDDAFVRSQIDGWRAQAIAGVNTMAAQSAKESKNWNLKGALVAAGGLLQPPTGVPAQKNCVVLVGGLAVRQPPPGLEQELASDGLLKGTEVVVAGWRSTPGVQDAWNKVGAKTGTRFTFLREEATEVYLVPTVRHCVGR